MKIISQHESTLKTFILFRLNKIWETLQEKKGRKKLQRKGDKCQFVV